MQWDERDLREDALFERLYDALSEEALSSGSLRESLKSAGVDADSAVREGQKLFASFLAQQRLTRARQRLDRVRALIGSVTETAVSSMEAARDELARILAGAESGEKYLAFHRQLQKIDRDDLASLTDDAALIDFLDHFESEEPHE